MFQIVKVFSTWDPFSAKHPILALVRELAYLGVWAALLTLPLMSREAVLSEQAGVTTTRAFDESLVFDISPQPLATALRNYSEFTGQAVLFDDTLTLMRLSPGVRGRFNAANALNHLLAGTGLVAKYSSNQSFTLQLVGSDPHSGSERSMEQEPNATADERIDVMTERYAGKIQQPIQAALCQSGVTRPGTYRLALQLWIAPSGKVQNTRLLSTPEVAGQHEPYVLEALDRLTLDPPPASLPQPVTLLLLQGNAMLSSPCRAFSRSMH